MPSFVSIDIVQSLNFAYEEEHVELHRDKSFGHLGCFVSSRVATTNARLQCLFRCRTCILRLFLAVSAIPEKCKSTNIEKRNAVQI